MVVERGDTLLGKGVRREAPADDGGHGVELAQAGVHVQPGILVLRDAQAGAREVEVAVGGQRGEGVEAGRHAARLVKSRGRKPSTQSVPRYTVAPSATTPPSAAARSGQGACSHQADGPAA